MTTNEWIYDCRHILNKLKDGADFVDMHAVLSLNQYRQRIIEERQRYQLSMGSNFFQRHFIDLANMPFSDTDETEVASAYASFGDIPAIIGDPDKSLRIFSSTGLLRATRYDQEKLAMLAEYAPDDYEKFLFYSITGTRIAIYPKVDQISIIGVFQNPFELYTIKELVIDGDTESAAGVKRNLTIYDEYPFDVNGMSLAIKLFVTEKFGVSMKIVEDYVADTEDELNILTSGQK